jgi:hypothetical protein
MNYRYHIELFDPNTDEKVAGFRTNSFERAQRTVLNAIEDDMNGMVVDTHSYKIVFHRLAYNHNDKRVLGIS